MLKIKNLAFSFGSKSIFENFNLHLKEGEIGTLIGPSGTGKTTLFKILTGMIPVKNGSIDIHNQQIQQNCCHAAYMTQEDLLLPWRNVIQNLVLLSELGPSPRSTSQLKTDALQLLRELGLDGYEKAYPHQLSGGMRQRISLARAMLLKRPLLLLDEPFSSLDISLRENLYLLLKKLQQQYSMTILMATHDFRDAFSLSDKIFLLSNKQISQSWTITPSIQNDPNALREIEGQIRLGLKLI